MRNSVMKQWFALVGMMRLGNALMAAVGILVGYLYSHDKIVISDLLFLMGSGIFALGFGNVVNDIFDQETDRISHPERALVSGVVTVHQVQFFAASIALLALLCGGFLSPLHGVAVLLPLALLWLYAKQLKGIPLVGNSVVALLVAYTLLFGALGTSQMVPLILPAMVAALGNFVREVVKDCADKEGDEAAGLRTSASLSALVLRLLVTTSGLLYLLLALLPYTEGSFGFIYLMVVFLSVYPLHVVWMWLWRHKRYKHTALVLKLQMIAGLIALLADHFLG